MFAFIPKSYEFKTSLSPKKAARKINHDLVEQRPSFNIMSNGRFMRNHRFESCYYGCRTSQFEFQIFHHTAKKHDGGTVGFYGTIEQSGDGSIIKGKFRKPIYTYVVAALWILFSLFCALCVLAVGEKIGAAAILAVALAGLAIMFWDSSEKMVKAYLDTFPRP